MNLLPFPVSGYAFLRYTWKRLGITANGCRVQRVAMGAADQRLAANLKAARQNAGMTQEAMAARMSGLGWPYRQQTLGEIENGFRAVPLGEAMDLARIVGSDV